VVDRHAFRPFRTGVALIGAAHRLAPEGFRWRSEPYEFVTEHAAIDLLTGNDSVRRGIERGVSVDEMLSGFTSFEREFAELRRPALIPEYS
jgi:uncharacterized protein YbbC (DUF1343 family)